MNSNKLDEFFKRNRIKLLNSSTRHTYPRYLMTRAYFNDPADYNIVDEMAATIHYETEKVHTIEVPESSLEKIIDFEDQVFNHMKTGNHFNLFETLMEQKHREKILRETYPALQKAYENYSLMLKLAESGEM